MLHTWHKTLFFILGLNTELDLHFIRDKVLRNELLIRYMPSADQVADIFTKHLSSSQFCTLRNKLSVISLPARLRGDESQTGSKAVTTS